jgi:hypothetical protein
MDDYRSRVTTLLARAALLAFCAAAPIAGYAADMAAVAEVDPSGTPPLPPISSIGPGSDIRVFLAPGVPEELRRAALRRTWATEPAIHDFIGLNENCEDRSSTETAESARQISHSELTQSSAMH